MIRLVHIIASLDTGGAETMLLKLVSHLDRTRFLPEVISLTDSGPIGDELIRIGVRVRSLGIRKTSFAVGLARLCAWLHKERPDVIQTWMYHADLIGGIAARLVGGIPIAWGVRQSDLDPLNNKRELLWMARACAHLSRTVPVKIVCCSDTGRAVHESFGYVKEKMVTIPNGFDLDQYAPSAPLRRAVRLENNVPLDAPLIGLMARFHPQKDHFTFVRAAAHLDRPDAHFLLCGTGVTWENETLAGWIRQAGLVDRFRLLGERRDVPRLLTGLDLAVSSSTTEGFSNVLGEAMATGVPCVATDVGDSALIIGETGRVVPRQQPREMAAAWRSQLDLTAPARAQQVASARRRIAERYSIASVAERYANLYEELAACAE